MGIFQCFGRVPPISGAGRNGPRFLKAPDIVNTVEQIDAQVIGLIDKLQQQKSLVQDEIMRLEDQLLAIYQHLYRGAPEAAPECAAVRRYFSENGEIEGGPEHIDGWVADWLSRLGVYRA